MNKGICVRDSQTSKLALENIKTSGARNSRADLAVVVDTGLVPLGKDRAGAAGELPFPEPAELEGKTNVILRTIVEMRVISVATTGTARRKKIIEHLRLFQ